MANKRKSGRRYKSGKLAKPTTREGRKAHDYGNDRIVAQLERFRHSRILDGKAAWIDVYDGIGQLHALGLLEGHGLDGKLLREAGRDYIGLYNYWYIDLLPKSADLQRVYGGRGGKSDEIPSATQRELRFEKLDALLPIRSAERHWTHEILLKNFGLDTVHPLVERLVNFKFAQWGLSVAGEIAGNSDFDAFACALRGLFALADGSLPDRRQMKLAA